ncbi:MAG: zinc-ribbon domain-containing protein [Rhodobacteraceae bacterium]|nr:zinc-ribbon domain-containing protein [Paracoccaceae bacterium]
MRLICPNCDAEYEVEDSAIPDTGRDVQCSNCGHAWFQLPPEIELALEQEDELFGQAAAADPAMAGPVAAPEPVRDPAPAQEDAEAVLNAALKADPPKAASAGPVPSDPPRRTLDDNLMTILREEAEREAAARRSEGSAIETQPDLGLAAPTAPPPSAPPAGGGLAGAARRIAQMQGIDPDAPPPAPPRPAARRDLLPDIEEINSSLKGNEAPVEAWDEDRPGAAAAEARGFRSGFALALFAAVILLAAYVAAPQIKAQIPALAGGLDAYVAGVDGLRLWLDGAMRAATDLLRGMTASEGGVAGG